MTNVILNVIMNVKHEQKLSGYESNCCCLNMQHQWWRIIIRHNGIGYAASASGSDLSFLFVVGVWSIDNVYFIKKEQRELGTWWANKFKTQMLHLHPPGKCFRAVLII